MTRLTWRKSEELTITEPRTLAWYVRIYLDGDEQSGSVECFATEAEADAYIRKAHPRNDGDPARRYEGLIV